MKRTTTALLLGLAVSAATGIAFAHGTDSGRKEAHPTEYGEQLDLGRVGKEDEVDRTIAVDLKDNFRFEPAEIQVRNGETLRLVFRNSGVLLHEWVLGTPQDIAEHAEMMKRFPNMEHDEPQLVHVPTGEKRELVWQFNRPGKFEFACLEPGHFEAGMKGLVVVK